MGAKSQVKRRERGEPSLVLPSSFEADLSGFLSWVQLEKGLARNTVASYETDLIQCADSLFSQGVANWREVRIEHLSHWLASLTEDAYAVASLSRKLSAVRMLAKYMVGEGVLKEDFTELMTNPKPGTPLVVIDLVFAFPSEGNHHHWLECPGPALAIEVEILLERKSQSQVADPAVRLSLLPTRSVGHFPFRIDDKRQLGGQPNFLFPSVNALNVEQVDFLGKAFVELFATQ